jgi:hypothetical protein
LVVLAAGIDKSGEDPDNKSSSQIPAMSAVERVLELVTENRNLRGNLSGAAFLSHVPLATADSPSPTAPNPSAGEVEA